ncbi:ATP-binding protein [Bradyrhizobium sp. CCBAU 51745]|uniref:ATP-binding protein n=1 Tax=Bradyrhizobium sp. CCBAU 51745 TaxID=1325099 RepID=UPI00230564F1|nr:ATP-binding protein [Bradyrhizobium sp. CCBAU 51745]
MNENFPARDIHLLTIDSLLADLVGGRAVTVAAGNKFSIGSDDARVILDWYRRNRGMWASKLSTDDIEAIVDVIGTTPAAFELVPDHEPAHTIKVLRLVKIVAHRFAGLHAYGRSLEPPDTFTFEPSKAVTLFEGANGSGKTSIANAIVWCLTGHLIRSQRPPEEGPTEFSCEIDHNGGETTTHSMSSVTPMPDKTADRLADGAAIPADSWV